MVDVAGNLRVIQARVAEAAVKVGRRPEDVTIVGAAKRVDPERINRAIAAGLTVVGENYVQEAVEKTPLLTGPVELHFLGHLQTNKAKVAVRLFDVIQCVDSQRLAQALDKRAAALGKRLRVLLEVNVGGEESKSGVSPECLPELSAQVAALEHLQLCGLMTMPPFTEDPEDARPFFRRLRECGAQLAAAGVPASMLTEYSMGMTHDYPIAVEEGATLIRIGTGLFGPRP